MITSAAIARKFRRFVETIISSHTGIGMDDYLPNGKTGYGHYLPNRGTAYGPVTDISASVQNPDFFTVISIMSFRLPGYGGASLMCHCK